MDMKTILAAFGALFLAEMGDKTQLAVITLAASTRRPGSVLLGAVVALALVAALGAFLGGTITRFVPAHIVQKAGALFFIASGIWIWVKS